MRIKAEAYNSLNIDLLLNSKYVPMVFQKKPSKNNIRDLLITVINATPLGTFRFLNDLKDMGIHTPIIHKNLKNKQIQTLNNF